VASNTENFIQNAALTDDSLAASSAGQRRWLSWQITRTKGQAPASLPICQRERPGLRVQNPRTGRSAHG